MDIEGSEIEALKGMKKTLECGPQMAIAAYHPVEGSPTHSVIVPQLEQIGFRVQYSDCMVRVRRRAENNSGPHIKIPIERY